MLAELLNNYWLYVLSFICINGLLGLSVYLVLSTGQLTLGNAGFMSLGAYTAAVLATKAGAPFWVTIPVGAVLAAVVAIPLGYACLRLRGVYLAIATLGFTETVRVIAENVEFTGGPLGIKNIPALDNLVRRWLSNRLDEAPLGLEFSQLAKLVVLLGVAAVLALAVAFVVRQARSRVGRAYTAIRTDEIAAGAMGVDTTYYKVLSFVQGAFIAGLAGGISAHTTFAIGPRDFAFSKAVEMLTYVVVGGSGVALGPILGSTALILMSELLRDFQIFGTPMKDYRLIIYGLLMMVVVAVRPGGLLTPDLGAAAGRWLTALKRGKGGSS